ncbi:unnamed protein product, partial [Fusarium fujikuroi]
ITANIARRNVDPSQSEGLDGLCLFDVNIIRDHDGTSHIGSNTSVTIRPLLLLATGAPGHIQPPYGGDWVSEHVQDMTNALQTQMNSPSDFYGERVVIRIAEQPWFNNNNSEDRNTEDHMHMQRVLWEFLERLEVWEPMMRPMEVSVVQTLATGTPQHLSQDGKGNKVDDSGNERQRRNPCIVMSCSWSFHSCERALPPSLAYHSTGGKSFYKRHLYTTWIHFALANLSPKLPGSTYKSEVIEEDLKAVDKIAALLLLHGIQDVVIAPCLHARSAIETAATVLLSSGMQTVVTLAYHITKNGSGYIHQSLPLEEAARAARRRLRGSVGDERLPICDFVVLTYVNPEWLPSTSSSVDYKTPKQEQSYPNPLYGREQDIVHIESILCLENHCLY